MNILHINSNYLGTNNVHRVMISELKKQSKTNKYKVFVPLLKKNTSFNDETVVSVKCFNMLDRVLFFNKQRKIRKALEKLINIDDYDCVHAFTLFTDGYAAYRIKKKYGTPYIVAIRSTDINAFLKYKPYLKGIAKKILDNSSAIIFLSDTYKNKLKNKLYPNTSYPFNNKTKIIPNGVDNFWINHINNKYRSINQSNIKAICVGKINKRKNIETAVKAINSFKNMSITVVGKNENSHILNRIIKEKNVTYLGEKNKEEILKLYREHDFFILPSHTETFGVVYAEAITQGLPVVYTKGQGFDEQFPEGEVGYHTDDTDVENIVNTIKKIIKNHETISENCINRCKKFYWPNICNNYEKLYQITINNKNKSTNNGK